MSTIFDSASVVKAASFAIGLFPARPARFVPLPEEVEWAATELNRNATDYTVVGPTDAALDHAAGCAMASSRMSAGYALL
jgi:hypothetical protein